MVSWGVLADRDPELAALGLDRFERTGLALVGTLRKNGWPRISPVEPVIAGGQLYLGMMWQSVKALDLLRDPRCTVHSTVSDRHGTEGEFKVYGRAVDVTDHAERDRFAKALFEKIGWRPEEPDYHLFSVDIQSAAWAVIRDGERIQKVWRSA